MKIKYVSMGLLISCICILIGIRPVEGQNISNQYGPPTYTGGTVNAPSEYFNANYKYAPAGVTQISTIFPNPALNSASVILTKLANDQVSLYVVNMNGTVLRTYTYDPGGNRLDFDVSSLPNGVYSIQVQERGKDMQSIKLLKEE